MIHTSKSISAGFTVPQHSDHDASWYGTVCMVAACLVLLTTLFLTR
jgi:hypothetical protein